MERNQSLHTYIKEELLHRIKTNQYQPGEKILPNWNYVRALMSVVPRFVPL